MKHLKARYIKTGEMQVMVLAPFFCRTSKRLQLQSEAAFPLSLLQCLTFTSINQKARKECRVFLMPVVFFMQYLLSENIVAHIA